jgi:hypothetical protein
MSYRATIQQGIDFEESDLGLYNQSATWPTATELSPGSDTLGATLNESPYGFREPFRGDLAEFFEPDDTDTLRVFAEPERHDTIPSPPPELESRPWHDERG